MTDDAPRMDYSPEEDVPIFPIGIRHDERTGLGVPEMTKRLSWRCRCCDTDKCHLYLVHDSVWEAAGLDPYAGCVCLPCLDERLIARRNSPLERDDFTSGHSGTANRAMEWALDVMQPRTLSQRRLIAAGEAVLTRWCLLHVSGGAFPPASEMAAVLKELHGALADYRTTREPPP